VPGLGRWRWRGPTRSASHFFSFFNSLFVIIKLYIFSNTLGQTLSNLTLTKLRIQGKKDRGSNFLKIVKLK
jgi:hypothetical protein